MTIELKPCPFCGGNFQTWGTVRDGRALGCSKCGAGFVAYHGPPENTAEMRIVTKWNTRTDATKDAEIARLREALEFARGAVNDNEHFKDVAEAIDTALEASQ